MPIQGANGSSWCPACVGRPASVAVVIEVEQIEQVAQRRAIDGA